MKKIKIVKPYNDIFIGCGFWNCLRTDKEYEVIKETDRGVYINSRGEEIILLNGEFYFTNTEINTKNELRKKKLKKLEWKI